LIQRHIWISGLVQGVGFRASTIREANRYTSLKGFVRNLSDGRVEVVVSGDEREVLALAAWLAHGPRSARVDKITVQEEEPDPALQAFGLGK